MELGKRIGHVLDVSPPTLQLRWPSTGPKKSKDSGGLSLGIICEDHVCKFAKGKIYRSLLESAFHTSMNHVPTLASVSAGQLLLFCFALGECSDQTHKICFCFFAVSIARRPMKSTDAMRGVTESYEDLPASISSALLD